MSNPKKKNMTIFNYIEGRERMSWNEERMRMKGMLDTHFKDTKDPYYRKDLLHHFGCVNAVEFSRDGSLMVSGGDDKRILVWKVQKAIVGNEEPMVLEAEHRSNVFALGFDCHIKKVLSGGNDEMVIIHDLETGKPLDFFTQEGPVFGIDSDPLNSNVFSMAGDEGHLMIYDVRDSSDPFCLAEYHSAFHSVMFHPVEPRLVLSANAKEGAALWDVRMPKRVLLKYGRQNGDKCCMNARFNQTGTQVLALRRRLPPVLYSTHSSGHLFQFNHSSYYNSCTMKSCCFGGSSDEFVISGSDNFDVHIWRIPQEGGNPWVDSAVQVLKGHRSIVNQVRYNYAHHIIASSGVEKMIKIWSPFAIPDVNAWPKNEPGRKTDPRREIFSHDGYIREFLRPSRSNLPFYPDGDGSRCTREDVRMMAFFDALVQRDLNGLSDDDESDSTDYTNTVYSAEESLSEHAAFSPAEELNDEEEDELELTEHQSYNRITPSSPDERPPPEVENAGVTESQEDIRLVDMEDLPVLDSSSTDSESNEQLVPHADLEADIGSPPPLHQESDSDDWDEFGPWTNPSFADPDLITKLVTAHGSHLRKLAANSRKPRSRRRQIDVSSTIPTPSNPNSPGSTTGTEEESLNPASPFPLRSQRDFQMTPKYESSTNSSHPSSSDEPIPGPSFQLVSELMTRNLLGSPSTRKGLDDSLTGSSSVSSPNSGSSSDTERGTRNDTETASNRPASQQRTKKGGRKTKDFKMLLNGTQGGASDSSPVSKEYEPPPKKRSRRRKGSGSTQTFLFSSSKSGSGTPSDSGIDVSRGEYDDSRPGPSKNDAHTTATQTTRSIKKPVVMYSDSSDSDEV